MFFQCFKFANIGIEIGIKHFTLIFQFLPFLFEHFDGIVDVLVLLVDAIVLVLQPFDLVFDVLDLSDAGVRHALHTGVLTHEVLDLKVGLL
jgi:hypothetical protein